MSLSSCEGRRPPTPPGRTISRKRVDRRTPKTSMRRRRIPSYVAEDPSRSATTRMPSSSSAVNTWFTCELFVEMRWHAKVASAWMNQCSGACLQKAGRRATAVTSGGVVLTLGGVVLLLALPFPPCGDVGAVNAS